MSNKITRRKFIKLTALVGCIISVSPVVSLGEKIPLNRKKSNIDDVRNRKKNSDHWLKPEEYALVGALAALIIPSDETGAGAREANVVDSLDSLLAGKRDMQAFYLEGLNAFDELAQSEYSQNFIELTYQKQQNLLELIDGTLEKLELSDSSISNRLIRKGKYYYYKYKPDGLGATIDLFPTLVKDVKRAFYSSQVSWDWLGYDGPPQPWGYIGRVSECA